MAPKRRPRGAGKYSNKTVRVPDEEWAEAQQYAREEGTSLSAKVIGYVHRYNVEQRRKRADQA